MKKHAAFFGVIGLCVSPLGCEAEAATEIVTSTSTSSQAIETVLNTFITDSIQIDVINGGPGDANLLVTADADSPSANLPTGGPGSFIDWTTLSGDLANHQLLDTDGAKGVDPTAFPLSNECVAPANVLSKMDLRYVASANNSKYAYFGVLRAANQGDAGYYWLFTRKPPKLIAGEAPCSADKQRLVYDISGPTVVDGGTGAVGDVLIKGHFKPSAEALLEVFHATRDEDHVTAVGAIDYGASLWVKDPAGVAAVAVNTTPTSPDGFGSVGVKSMTGANLGTELFAEAAVPLSVFTGASTCGATFYGSVITRSSGAGGTSPDLKDLAGPALFNFGSASVEAHLEGSCGEGVEFVLDSATGADGQEIGAPECVWTFDDGVTEKTECTGNADLGPGTYGASVTVTDPVSECTDTVDIDPVEVFASITVELQRRAAAETCGTMTDDAVVYDAVASGGGADLTYTWSGVTCSGTSCTVDPDDDDFCYGPTTLSVTVDDGAGQCASATSEEETYEKVTTVTASDN